ncbi:DMT family transporter [Bacteroides sp. OttesenSCG-928-E20]|nr:DMT family transporter [Bacteroides sp. OttesenSCG-928-N06]MDL2299346.1 DMT family transporter [Bacteroides sp. OttesenSCG-928-E20]MDL2304684.1 DMT family transporter [Bacteroides sp. OttesenSCG-928-D19]
MTHDRSLKGHAAVLIANVLWGLNAPISKSVLAEFTALSVTTFRMLGAAICFLILSFFLPREHIPPKDMLRLFFASVFGIVFNQGMFILGLSLTSPIDSSIIATTSPIVTMIIAAIYLKEPVTHKKVMGIFLGAIGALILIFGSQPSAMGGSSSILGNAFCLIGQFSFAIYLTVFKDLIQKYSPVTINKWLFIYASLCFIPVSYSDMVSIDFATIPMDIVWQLLYVVLAATFLTYILIVVGQRLLRPTIVSMYNYVQPIVATILAVIWGMDTFGITKGLAIGLVFLGVYVVTQSKSKAELE